MKFDESVQDNEEVSPTIIVRFHYESVTQMPNLHLKEPHRCQQLRARREGRFDLFLDALM
jgi:hypothetical protein